MCGPRVAAWVAGRTWARRRREGGSAGPRSAPSAAGGVGGGAAEGARSGSVRAEASTRGAAPGRGKRAAPMRDRFGDEAAAREARGLPDIPLVALARQFAPLSAEHTPSRFSFPAMLERDGASRPRQRAGRGGGKRGAGRLRQRQRRNRPAQGAPRQPRGGAWGGGWWRGGRAAWRTPARGGPRRLERRCNRRKAGLAAVHGGRRPTGKLRAADAREVVGRERRLTQRPRRGKRATAQQYRTDDARGE